MSANGSSLPAQKAWCPSCQKQRPFYHSEEGDSTPLGSMCCAWCQSVMKLARSKWEKANPDPKARRKAKAASTESAE